MKKIYCAPLPIKDPDLSLGEKIVQACGAADGFFIFNDGWGLSPLLLAPAIKKSGKEVWVKLLLRDQNRIALRGDFVSYLALGVTGVIIASGTHPLMTPYPSALPVYDYDLRQAVRELSALAGDRSVKIGVELGELSESKLKLAAEVVADGAGVLVLSGKVLPDPARLPRAISVFWSGEGDKVAQLKGGGNVAGLVIKTSPDNMADFNGLVKKLREQEGGRK